MTSIFIAILSSTLLSTLITTGFNIWQTKHNEDNSLKEAVKCSLYSDIKRECLHAINDGFIDVDSLEALEESFKAYKALGGNGFIDSLLSKTRALPIK